MSESITVTVVVRADPAAAFRMFTDDVDAWWKRGPRYRSGEGAMRFDADRLWEGSREIGRVLAWEPGNRLRLELPNWPFGEGLPAEVEVRFEAVGHGTRVTVEHRRPDSKLPGAAQLAGAIGLWWGTLLAGLQHASR
jgi:uncharacterized protein YndB with AHSA1/START domain